MGSCTDDGLPQQAVFHGNQTVKAAADAPATTRRVVALFPIDCAVDGLAVQSRAAFEMGAVVQVVVGRFLGGDLGAHELCDLDDQFQRVS